MSLFSFITDINGFFENVLLYTCVANNNQNKDIWLLEKCPYLKLFWSAFSRIRTEYGEILSISPYSIRMRENTDQKNSEYGHFSRSVRRHLLIFFIRAVLTWQTYKNMTVCSYHVMYAFQSDSALYSCLNVKELLARNRREI